MQSEKVEQYLTQLDPLINSISHIYARRFDHVNCDDLASDLRLEIIQYLNKHENLDYLHNEKAYLESIIKKTAYRLVHRAKYNSNNTVSLDALIENEEDNIFEVKYLSTSSDEVEEYALNKELIQELIKNLSSEEQEFINLIFYSQYALTDEYIINRFGKGRKSAVFDLYYSILEKLREEARKIGLERSDS